MQIDFNLKEPDQNISLERLKSAYRSLFLNNPEGRIVLDDLANRSHFFKGVATPNANELMQIEGMRIMYLHISYYLTMPNSKESISSDYRPFEQKPTKATTVKDFDPFDKKK
jgi:hypothetical protein